MNSLQDGLLLQALTALEAAQTLGVVTSDAEAWATLKRQRDELLGVWSNGHDAFVYPSFKFDSSVQLERLTQLLRILRTRTGFDPVQDDRGGWGRAYWLHQPHAQLSEAALHATDLGQENPVALALALRTVDDTARTPADAFMDHPNAVIALATDLAEAAWVDLLLESPSHWASAGRFTAVAAATENSSGTAVAQKSNNWQGAGFGPRVVKRGGLPVIDLDDALISILEKVRPGDFSIRRLWAWWAESLDELPGCNLQNSASESGALVPVIQAYAGESTFTSISVSGSSFHFISPPSPRLRHLQSTEG